MIEDLQRLIEEYHSWLKDKTTLRQLDNSWVEISTPHLDRHNDHLQIYAKQEESGFLLSDDGYIIQDLELTGCALDTPKRRALLNLTLNGFGVSQVGSELQVKTTAANFALKKHNLLQAMVAVNDLFYLASPFISTIFLEDVTSWLESVPIRFTPNVKFTGHSGFDHLFDFVIPSSSSHPERILKAINKPSKDNTKGLIFAWLDTKQVRPENSKAYAFLNDSEQSLIGEVVDALQNYDVTPVPWSRRTEYREELAA